jgi:hypothetical protein
MNENKTEFYKEREFGEYIGIPITFFIQEFKLLIKSLLIFVGPFVLLEVILSYYLKFEIEQNFFSILSSNGLNNYSGYTFIFQILQLFQSVMLSSLIGVYIKLYIASGRGTYDISDIWEGIKRFYFAVLGGQILAGLIIIVGFLLIIFPGIYVAVVMSLLFPIIIFEEEGVGKSVSRTFEVIKGNWWTVFGAYIIFFIIIVIVLAISGLLIGAIFGLFGGFHYLTSGFTGIIELITSSIFSILSVLLYTSFSDKKEKPDLLSRINQISQSDEDLNVFEVKENNQNDSDSEKNKQQDDNNYNDDIKEKNRFTDEDDNNRFKPKI